jgi:hypothetical protein
MEQVEQIGNLNLDFTYKIEFLDFLIKLMLSIVFSYILSFSFRRFGHSINRSTNLISNSIILSIIVTLIITVVKSSLALSLGLVGALSIVRFRNAIKDPLELLVYFSSIGIGLSNGADQYLASGLFSIVVLVFNYSNFKLKKRIITDQSTILLLKFSSSITLDYIISKLDKLLKKEYKLISMTKNESNVEVCFELYDLSSKELVSIQKFDNKVSTEIIPSTY